MSRRAVVAAVLLGALALSPSARAAPACERSLWGCPSSAKPSAAESGRDKTARYADLCARGRRALRLAQVGGRRDLPEAANDLSIAVQLAPTQPEALALLGAIELELEQYDEAELTLRRAERAGEEATVPLLAEKPLAGVAAPRVGALASLDPQLDVLVVTGLAFLDALHGDVRGALERSRRLVARRGTNHRALSRAADLLMALGNLTEATALYERACTLPRGPGSTTLDIARSCHGLVVALDRGERARSYYYLYRVALLDPDHNVAEMSDIYPLADREYYRALTMRPGCPRLFAFQSYLRAAREQSGIPGSYLRRAEEHLADEQNLSCPPDL